MPTDFELVSISGIPLSAFGSGDGGGVGVGRTLAVLLSADAPLGGTTRLLDPRVVRCGSEDTTRRRAGAWPFAPDEALAARLARDSGVYDGDDERLAGLCGG